ncbi:alpha/beta hydrolase [Streptosporangiaceae bacterium NEAU-GS5]|nr:alpha/beta hydrolase [Streptosporangiaceae bacterium NEAU-GS5]
MSYVAMDDGVRLWTQATGAPGSPPPVVLLHGGPGMWDYLRPVARLLDDRTIVHRFDQRGCGKSDASDDQRLDRLIADLETLRRHWAYDQWTVVGHSFGASYALAYAWTHPERIASLCYLSGTGIGDWRPFYRAERARRMTARQRARLVELESKPHRSASQEREFRTLSWFTDHADRERAWQWAEEDATATTYPINFAANRKLAMETASWTADAVRAACRRIIAPAAVVHGAGDPRPASSAAAVADALPHARFHLLPDAGHHPWREQPDALRDILRAL